jgi:hypothetical protein
MDAKLLISIGSFTALLIIACIFGRLHGSGNTSVGPVGDRVIAGLLALPLISFLVHYGLKNIAPYWKWIAPAPLAIYIFLLAATDFKCCFIKKRLKFIKDHFTLCLIVGVGVIYLLAAMYYLWG